MNQAGFYLFQQASVGNPANMAVVDLCLGGQTMAKGSVRER